jgi:hypothetical protein
MVIKKNEYIYWDIKATETNYIEPVFHFHGETGKANGRKPIQSLLALEMVKSFLV